MCENGVTDNLEAQSFASGGHTKKVDGLSLRKLGAWGSFQLVSSRSGAG